MMQGNVEAISSFFNNPTLDPNAMVTMFLKSSGKRQQRRMPIVDAACFSSIGSNGSMWVFSLQLLLQRPELVIKPDSIALCIICKRYDLALQLLCHKNMSDINEPCVLYCSRPKSLFQIAIEKVVPLYVIMAILNHLPNINGLTNASLLRTEPHDFEDSLENMSKCPGFMVDADTMQIILKKFTDDKDALFFVLKMMQYPHDRNRQMIIKVESKPSQRVSRVLEMMGYTLASE